MNFSGQKILENDQKLKMFCSRWHPRMFFSSTSHDIQFFVFTFKKLISGNKSNQIIDYKNSWWII